MKKIPQSYGGKKDILVKKVTQFYSINCNIFWREWLLLVPDFVPVP